MRSVRSPANFRRSPGDTPGTQPLQIKPHQHGIEPPGPLPLSPYPQQGEQGWQRSGSVDPGASGAISPDARSAATAGALETHHHSNKFKSLQKKESSPTIPPAQAVRRKAELLGKEHSLSKFHLSISSWVCLQFKSIKLMYCLSFRLNRWCQKVREKTHRNPRETLEISNLEGSKGTTRSPTGTAG